MGRQDIRGKARFSPCGRYRWWLRRCWDPALPPLLFLGCNPSRADGRRDDPTLRRLVGLARGWGFGALEVLNLYARITPAPALLRRLPQPVGGANDLWLGRRLALLPQAPVWVGWGAAGSWSGRRLLQLVPLLQSRALLAVGQTAGGHPRHPLYVPATAVLEPWSWRIPKALGHPGHT
ncbi:DUF1643 domain-containing protein [Cyanobium sp. NIES-981]|uniref:DUF1643 domain-containing protein n=1 Tax=Cyanobium sp. NIES-981 TaxID=1851505 RepID=UPI0007DD8BFF|nr:DUF1643 domain-containing protein [Cyanobium sp. NIES-981]SBO41727.1 conserved protein of unknown function [Cyanobium sp. NIES-981]